MKRFLVILIGLALLSSVACFRIEWNVPGSDDSVDVPVTEAAQAPNTEETAPEQPTEEPATVAVTTPEPVESPSADGTDASGTSAALQPTDAPTPYHPDLSKLPIVYNVYEEVGWYVTDATMFRYDIDFDGHEEEISFHIDEENYTTTIKIDDQSVTLEDGDQFARAILIDLDPATPYVDLLISIDEASDDYITTMLHYDDKQILVSQREYDLFAWDSEEQALIRFERTDMLGTTSGTRIVRGEDLIPDSEWIDVAYSDMAERLESERDELIEYGTLLHCTRDLPCEINGSAAKISKGAYIYLLRYTDDQRTAEISTEDGVRAVLHLTYEDWEYRIDNRPVADYFDNLFYAD